MCKLYLCILAAILRGGYSPSILHFVNNERQYTAGEKQRSFCSRAAPG